MDWFWRVCPSSVDVLIHENVHQEYQTVPIQKHFHSHQWQPYFEPMQYMPSTVLLQKQFYTDTNTVTHCHSCLYCHSCLMTALTWAHAHRPSTVLMQKQFYTQTDTITYGSFTLSPCICAQHCSYAEENFTQTDNVSNDNLTMSPCIQAEHCFYLMQKQFCTQKDTVRQPYLGLHIKQLRFTQLEFGCQERHVWCSSLEVRNCTDHNYDQ